MMKRILVTGGAGFIGSHLCERLVNEGNDVICLDNFYTGSKENVWHLIGRPNFEIVRHDVCQPYWAEVDEIYNLACPASPVYYQNDPIQTTKTSVFGAYHMLGLARRTKCKILQTSTSEVYGDPSVHPQPESYWGNVNTIGIRSCYDEGKRCAETMFFDYHRLHGVRIKVIRIFNTYGPRMAQNDGRVVSNFIMQALRGEDITIYGDGQQTRSFQYVTDLIEGMVRMMNSGDDFLGPVNIGNPGEFTMLELAEKVIAMTGSKSKIVFRPLPSDDPKMRRPDITLAKSKLDWAPKVPLDEGLAKTIEYFKERLEKIRKAVGKEPYADYVYFMCYTGFRPNEMLSLKKDAYKKDKNVLIGGFKTEAGKDRTVPVSAKIAPILAQRMASESKFIFSRPDGTMMDDEHFRKYCFVPLMKKLGIEGKVPYSCRHTFANLLKNVRGSDTDKAALIGHSDASMTKYYQSPDYESLQAIIANL